MKKEIFTGTLILTVSYLLFVGCGQTSAPTDLKKTQHEYSLTADKVNNSSSAQFTLIDDSTTFNFGKIVAGDTVRHTFHFKNTGKGPLIISSATATCGCTIADFNKRPIAPGHADSITAIFASSKDAKGFANKVVTVNYNSPSSPKLFTLYGRVK
jgi:hypothetical protein